MQVKTGLEIALGRAVAALRAERGMTRYDLRDAATVSYPYIVEIEKGRKTPSHVMLARVAIALGTTASGLMARAERIQADVRNGLT